METPAIVLDMRARTALLLSALLLAIACRRGVSVTSQASAVSDEAVHRSSWRDKAIRMLNEGRCRDVRQVLQTVPATQVTEDWYALRAMGEAACWSQSHAPAERQAALAAIDEGIQRYPESAPLVADKGAILESFGNVAAAIPLYQVAHAKAAQNLKRQPASRTNWNVLNSMSRRLRLPPPAPLPSDLDSVESTNDIEEGRPPWQAEASRLIAAGMMTGNCYEAIRHLDQHTHRDDAMWYELYSQADVVCWQSGAGDNYRQQSLAILDDGERALPNSSRILKSRGDRYELFGDSAQAKKSYAAAKAKAESNLRSGAHPGGEDQDVLYELGLTNKTD